MGDDSVKQKINKIFKMYLNAMEYCEMSVRSNYLYKNHIKPVLDQKANKMQVENLESVNNNHDLFIADTDYQDQIIPLDASLKNQFEKIFKADFSNVRIHIGKYADEIARKHNAYAITKGNDIYFADGKFMPDSEEGLRILTHELSHILQNQKGMRFLYDEDFQKGEAEAERLESKLGGSLNTFLQLQFADEDLVDVTGQSGQGNDNFLRTTTALAKTSDPLALEQKNLDDFTSRNDKPIYKLIMPHKTYYLTKAQREKVINETIKKLNEVINAKRDEDTSFDYDKYVVDFMEFMGKG